MRVKNTEKRQERAANLSPEDQARGSHTGGNNHRQNDEDNRQDEMMSNDDARDYDEEDEQDDIRRRINSFDDGEDDYADDDELDEFGNNKPQGERPINSLQDRVSFLDDEDASSRQSRK